MSVTFEPFHTNPELAAIGQIRALIKDGKGKQLSDDDIKVCILVEGGLSTFGLVKRASAQALDTIASNMVIVHKRIETLGLKTDGPAEAKELRAHAASLRQQVKDAINLATPDDPAGQFAFVSMATFL